MHPLTLRLNAFLRDDLRQEGRVALHEPLFDGREWEYVKECLDTGWVSTVGAFVTRFEKDFAAFTGAKHAIVAVNGTAALHMALYGAGVRPGDLVICPTLTFVATANAIAHCGATPLFIDSDPETLGLSVPALRETLTRLKPGADGPTLDGRRVGACVPVHIFGHAADIEEIAALCSAHGITMIEDATEGLGANKGGVALGRFGLSGVFSFNGNKIITTGGGGMIVTDDDAQAERLKHLTTTARVKDGWNFTHDEVGWNYRLPNINAAIGCAQLESLPGYVTAKRALAARYARDLAGMQGVRFFNERAGTHANFWLNAVLLDDRETRDRVLEETNAAGIETRPCWRLMHRLKPYEAAPRAGSLAGAEWIEDRLVNLPSSVKLGQGVLAAR